MKRGEFKILIAIAVLVLGIIAIFALIAVNIFSDDKKELQYANIPQTTTNTANGVAYDSGDGLMVLEKMSKPIEYCTDVDCKIRSIEHVHYGDRVNYDPTKLKEGLTEDSLRYTTYPISTGAGTEETTFDATTTDKITEWYVIGVEGNQLVLLAGNTTNTLLGLNGALGVVNSTYEMEKVCSIYGNGLGAQTATCLSLERLNQMVGVSTDLASANVTHKDGAAVEYLFNYGKEVKYETSRIANEIQIDHTDPWTQLNLNMPTYITQYIVKKKPLTVISGYYGYALNSSKITGSNSKFTTIKLAQNKDMWLSSIGMNADETMVHYGPAGITSDNIVVSAIDLFASNGAEQIGKYPVRPIVKLEANVNTGKIEKILD